MKLPNLGEFKVLTLRETPIELLHHMCDTPECCADYYRRHVQTDVRYTPEVETMHCLIMSVRRRTIGHYLVASGTLDTILCDIRAVFRPAIVANASALVLFHNHPSGDPTPSEGDIKVTRDLIRAGQLLKLDVLDHLIMGQVREGQLKDYVSLRELGYFYV